VSTRNGAATGRDGTPDDKWASGPYSSSRGAVRTARPWYLRPATLAGAVVVAFVAVAIISDIPARAGHAQKISDAKGYVTEAYGYLNSCNAALEEAFNIAGQVASGTLSSGDMQRVPDLLRDDNVACSYTNDDVFQLDSMTVPRSVAELDKLQTALSLWVVPDAYGATSAITVLAKHPGEPAASAQLRKYDAKLNSDRASAQEALAAIDHQLGITLPPLRLFVAPSGLPPLAGS
jgi:hypothetical protein